MRGPSDPVARALELALRRVEPDRLWVVRVKRDRHEADSLAAVPPPGQLEPGVAAVGDDALLDRDAATPADRGDGDRLEHRPHDLIPPGRVEPGPRIPAAEED